MNRLIYVLAFLTVNCNSQQAAEIDKTLQPYISDYIFEANKRDINGYRIVNNVKAIFRTDVDIYLFKKHGLIISKETKIL